MNRHHPYGGYDAGPNDRGNHPIPPANDGYGGERLGQGYYQPPAPPQHHMQSQQPQHLPPQHYSQPAMNGQGDYQGYPEGGQYPPQQNDYQTNPPSAMHPRPPPPIRDGRGGSGPAMTLGSGPLNNASQYGGPIRYDGPTGGQSPSPMMQNHHPYGSPVAPRHYTAENASNPARPLAPPARQAQGYDSHLPPKPPSAFPHLPVRPMLGSAPSHLPRPPVPERAEDQPNKRFRRDGSISDEYSEKAIKDRLKRERPCRTLFVRNVEFSASLDDLRRRFEAFGEIKSYFDLTSKRGLLFISYFDLRSAEHAKVSMQDYELNGRRLDVHYSLPREEDMTKRCDRDKDQGTLFILLKRAQGELNDDEVRATFAQFGVIKGLRRYKDQGNCRFLEYYDCRACKAAHDAMFGANWNGGTWDIKYAWDSAVPDRAEKPRYEGEPIHPPPPPPGQGYPEFGREAPLPMQHQPPPPAAPTGPLRWGNEQQAYGARPPPSNNYPQYGPQGGADFRATPPGPSPTARPPPPAGPYGTKRPFDYDERGPEPPMRRWGQPQGSANPTAGYGRPRPEQAGGPGGPGGGPGGSYGPGANPPPHVGQGPDYGRYGGERNEFGRPPPGGVPPAPNRWGPGAASPIGNGGYGPSQAQQGGGVQGRPPLPQQRPPPPQTPAGPAAPPTDDRLEQAQKVQQLLASLKPANLGVGPAAPRPPPSASPVPVSSPAPAAAAAPAPSLPSNIAALLQMAQSNAGRR